MQHEGQTLGRIEAVEHHQQRQTDGIRQQRLAFGIGLRTRMGGRVASGGRFQRFLALRLARAQHVEADACNNSRKPAAEVIDAVRAGAAQAQPGFLDGVVGIAQRAEHPVGHTAQMSAVFLEPLRQKVVLVHRSHSPALFRHGNDEPDSPVVT